MADNIVTDDPGQPTTARLVNQAAGIYAVDSHRGEAKSYLVNIRTLTCSCGDFLHRRAHRAPTDPERCCKHLLPLLPPAEPATATPAPPPPIHSSVKVYGPTTDREAYDRIAPY